MHSYVHADVDKYIDTCTYMDTYTYMDKYTLYAHIWIHIHLWINILVVVLHTNLVNVPQHIISIYGYLLPNEFPYQITMWALRNSNKLASYMQYYNI